VLQWWNATGMVIFKVLAREHKVLLLIPKGEKGVSDGVWQLLERCKPADGVIEVLNVDVRHALTGEE